jgi:hypothetical protein
LFALETQKIVIRATLRSRKVTTGQWARVIDHAAASFGIEEKARLSEQWILLASQDPFLFVKLSEAGRRNFFGHTEMFCKSADVSGRYLYSLVNRAAIRGAVNAIVKRLATTIRSNVSHDR